MGRSVQSQLDQSIIQLAAILILNINLRLALAELFSHFTLAQQGFVFLNGQANHINLRFALAKYFSISLRFSMVCFLNGQAKLYR